MAKTPNVALNLIPFDQIPWDVDDNENMSILDGILGQYFAIANFVGIWKNATTYLVGQNVIDAVNGSQWVCNVGNTSPTAPTTFATDRAAHPANWTQTGASAASYAAAASASAVAAAASAASAAGPGELSGLGLVYNTTTSLSISAGTCTDSTATATIILGAMNKTISGVWVAGTNNVGMGLGLTATLNTWYHVFAIVVGGSADVYFDTSITAANKPVGTTAFRRIGSIKLDASVHITQFVQNGDRFDWAVPVSEYNAVPGVTTAATLTLTAIPPGLPILALLNGYINDTVAGGAAYISSLAQTDVAPSINAAIAWAATSGGTAFYAFYVPTMTNTSAQIRRRVSTATMGIVILNNGWIDTRGRG